MKRLLIISVVFVSGSVFFLQSSSFTTAEIKNETLLSTVDENDALIAIDYGEGKSIIITNNMEETIRVDKVELLDGIEKNILEDKFYSISPGEKDQLVLDGESESLSGRVIQITANWENGYATIQSTLPKYPHEEGAEKSGENQEKELVSETKEETALPIIEKDKDIPEEIKKKEIVDAELIDKLVSPVIVEPIVPEILVE